METSNDLTPPSKESSIRQILRQLDGLDKTGKQNLLRKWQRDVDQMSEKAAGIKSQSSILEVSEVRRDQLKYYESLIDIYESVLHTAKEAAPRDPPT